MRKVLYLGLLIGLSLNMACSDWLDATSETQVEADDLLSNEDGFKDAMIGVYINMDEFFNGKRGHETFAGQGFSIELIRRYGIRTSELGDYSMEYDLKSPEQQAEVCNVVRFAVNRSQLSREHLDYVIAAVKALYEDQETIPNMRIVRGRTLPMRHFHAFLEPYPAQ